MATGRYPPLGLYFSVRFEGIGITASDIAFQQVQGLESTIQMRPFEEGGENRITYQLPEKITYSDITLIRGAVRDSTITQWCLDAMERFRFSPVDLLITLHNAEQKPLIVWNVVGAIPHKWKLGELNAESSEVFIETLTLKIRYFNTILNP